MSIEDDERDMNKLIITAHPSSLGFTHKIAHEYKRGAEKSGYEVEILDLYKTELRENYLNFKYIKNIPDDPVRQKIQAKIEKADELVFIFPLWWLGAPAILKNFVDCNLSAGFAYRYKKFPIIGSLPVGLLKNKTARIFVTCDGPLWVYRFYCIPFRIIWRKFILGFCGVRTKSFIIFDKMRKRNQGKRDKWLKKVYKLGSK